MGKTPAFHSVQYVATIVFLGHVIIMLVLGPKGNGVTKSSLLLQLDHCSTRWVVEALSTLAVADVESEMWDSPFS
ncbi:hypothetical protein ACH5RR_026687 [Cinchona calisaya]|uniref:Uncharacterized protein n=1 Tax=Cinchona calisaya TaxID=153742 RepID=A0ABD2Z6K7_9GENT